MSPLRILAVTPYFPPEGGGLERYAQEILTRLAPRHDVRVLALTRNGHDDALQGSLEVRRTSARRFVGNTPVDLSFPRIVREEVRDLRPDVVVAHTPVPFAAEAASRAAAKEQVPFVLTYHAGRLRGSNPALDMAAVALRCTLEQAMIGRSDALIAVSPFVRDHALAARRDEVSVIPPGVDVHRFRPARRPLRPHEILFVAPVDNAYRWKGLDVLWDAFCRVQARHPDATLRLVGTGDRVPEFKAKAKRNPGLIVHGPAGDQELVRLCQQAAALVLPSTTDAESFGMVLAEANACARPVVASRIGGIPGHVRHGHNGLLATPGDADDLADQIMRILDDPKDADRMGRNGRMRVRRNHDWHSLAGATERVLARAAR